MAGTLSTDWRRSRYLRAELTLWSVQEGGLAKTVEQMLVCSGIAIDVPIGTLLDEAGMQPLAFFGCGLRLFQSPQVTQTDGEDVLGVRIIRTTADRLTQPLERLLVLPRINIGASQVSEVTVDARVAWIEPQGFFQKRLSGV